MRSSCRRKNPVQISERHPSSDREKILAKNQVMFFAATSDISSILDTLENFDPIQYTRTGLFNSDRIPTYASYNDIPDFGRTTHPSAIASPNYLLSPQGAHINIRPVPQKAGGVLFAVDQLINPDTVALRPGGRYGRDVILYGALGTVSQSVVSKKLYVSVGKALRKSFTRQEEFLVGPEAAELWRSGVRLTIGAESPTEFDLKPPQSR